MLENILDLCCFAKAAASTSADHPLAPLARSSFAACPQLDLSQGEATTHFKQSSNPSRQAARKLLRLQLGFLPIMFAALVLGLAACASACLCMACAVRASSAKSAKSKRNKQE